MWSMWSDLAKVASFEAAEDIMNNSVCIIDRQSQKIRNPYSVDDWQRNETVLVYNVPGEIHDGEDSFLIKAGEMCRCWRIWIQF